jgi:hypothetical protein
VYMAERVVWTKPPGSHGFARSESGLREAKVPKGRAPWTGRAAPPECPAGRKSRYIEAHGALGVYGGEGGVDETTGFARIRQERIRYKSRAS